MKFRDPVGSLRAVKNEVDSVDRIAASFASQDWRTRTIVTLLAVAAVVVSAAAAPASRGVLGATLSLLMLAVTLTDMRFFVIPNGLNIGALVLGLLFAGVRFPEVALESVGLALLRAVVLAATFYAVRTAYRWWRGREGVGLGDVKLAGVAGVWLDWPTIPIAIEAAALSALAAYGLRLFVLRREFNRTDRLPFGAFFAPAIWLGWLIEVVM